MKKKTLRIISLAVCAAVLTSSTISGYAAPISVSENSNAISEETIEEIRVEESKQDIDSEKNVHEILEGQQEAYYNDSTNVNSDREDFRILETDEQGRPISTKCGNEYVTIKFDDENNSITKYYSSAPFDGSNFYSKIIIRTIEKNEFNSVLVVTYEHEGLSSIVEYDENENITKEVTEEGVTTVNKYEDGKLIEKIYPYTGMDDDVFHTTRYEYNDSGLQTAIYVPAGEKSDGSVRYFIQKNTYDEKGFLIAEEQTVNKVDEDELFSKTEYDYDSNGNLIMTTEYDTDGSIAAIAQYYYDDNGHQLRQYTGLKSPLTITGLDQVTAGGDNDYNVVKYEYEGDQLIRETDSEGNLISYTYNEDGLLSEKVDKNGNRHVYTYRDGIYRESEKIYSNNDAKTIEEILYIQEENEDGNWGMLTDIKNKDGNVHYEYDSFGNLTKETDPNGNVVSYCYDEFNRITNIAVETSDNEKLGATKYEYDKKGNLKRITDAKDKTIASYNYDKMGRLKNETLGNGVATDYKYNKTGLLEGYQAKKKGFLADVAFEYSVNGNIISENDALLGNKVSYEYDGLNRLVNVETENGQDAHYDYDESGNCISVKTNKTVTLEYDKANHIIKKGNETIAYDLEGNLVKKGSTKYKYDYNNRLISVEDEEYKISYRYDTLGHLISRTQNGVEEQYIWANDQIIAQTGSENIYYYNDMDSMVASEGKTDIEFYVRGKRGDISAITNEYGDVLELNEYSAFGQKKQNVTSNKNKKKEKRFEPGYTGCFYDAEAELVYLNARFYSPELGVFMTEDSVEGQDNDVMTLNRYAYCTNDPINYTDRTGHWKKSLHENMSSTALSLLNNSDATLANCIAYTAGWTDAYLHYSAGDVETINLSSKAKNRIQISSLAGYLDQTNYNGTKSTIKHTNMSPYHGRGHYSKYLAYILGIALQFKKGYQIQNLTLRNDEQIYKQINFDLLIRLGSLYEGEAAGSPGTSMSRQLFSNLILGVGVHLCEDLWAHTALVTKAELTTVKSKLKDYNGLVNMIKTYPISCNVVRSFAKNGVTISESDISESETTARGQERQNAAINAAKRYIFYFNSGKIMYSGSKVLEGTTSATNTDKQRLSKLACSSATHTMGTLGTAGTNVGASTLSVSYGSYVCNSCKTGNSDSCNQLFYSDISGTNNKPEMGWLKPNK